MDGVPTGLDYGALPAALQGLGVVMSRELFLDLQAMERAALAVWRAPRRETIR